MSRVRTALLALCITLPLLSFATALLAWLTHGIDLPYMDDWRQYLAGNAGSFAPGILFEPSNDTLYPVGIALDAAAARWLGGNAVAYQAASMFVTLLSLLGLQWLLLRHVLRDLVLTATAFCFTVLMLQPGSYWGLQNMAYHQAIPLICMLAALYAVVASRMSRGWMFSWVVLLGLVSGMTYISGAFAYLACGIVLLCQSCLRTEPARSNHRTAGIGMTLAGLLTSLPQAWVIVFYQKGTHRADAPLALPHEADFWFYLLGKVGRSLLLPAQHPALSLCVSLAALFLLGVILVMAYRRSRTEQVGTDSPNAIAYADGFTVLLTLSVGVAAYLALVAAGRANLRDPGMVDGLAIFSFGYLRFHFFWVTLLWPWVAGLSLAWAVGRWPRTHRWLPYAAAAGVMSLAFAGGGFDHMNSQKLLSARRLDGIGCIRQQADELRPILCDSVEKSDLRRALEYAEQLDSTFVRDNRASARAFTPAGEGAETPISVGPGEFIDGDFPAAHSGQVSSLAFRIGNYFETSDGQVAVTVCNASRCSTGYAGLANTPDNSYLEIRLPDRIEVQHGATLRFRISSHHATRPFAVWSSPTADKSARIFRIHGPGGDRFAPDRTLRIATRYHK